MNPLRWCCAIVLTMIACLALCSGVISHYSYDQQVRTLPDSPPTRTFPLGTDELGRDRLARLLYGSRISLTLAPAAAFLSVLLAALAGGIAGLLGGRWAQWMTTGSNLTLSLPWLFLLMGVRAA